MRLYKVINLILCLCLASGLVAAKEIQVVVKLAEIKAEQPSTKTGDDLYINVTYYSSLGASKDLRVPLYPAHWLSKQVSKLKNVILWSGSLQEGESVKLVLSLVDQELPPWDVDESLGGAELHLSNHQGSLKKEWVNSSVEDPKAVEMLKPASKQHYIFKGEGSRYDVGFLVEQE